MSRHPGSTGHTHRPHVVGQSCGHDAHTGYHREMGGSQFSKVVAGRPSWSMEDERSWQAKNERRTLIAHPIFLAKSKQDKTADSQVVPLFVIVPCI